MRKSRQPISAAASLIKIPKILKKIFKGTKILFIIKPAISSAMLFLAIPAFGASAGTFSDVPMSSPYYTAVETLSAAEIIQGYTDGTFGPDKEVNRAEALKLILAGAGVQVGKGLYSTGFPDVPIDSWYAPYVMEGLSRQIIAGNPDGTFAGERTVNLAEYLKILILTHNIDLSMHQGIDYWIAADVPPGEWYTPYLSYARTLGLANPDLSDNLYPAEKLTRGQCAQILYKLLIIIQGGEAQKYLSLAEARLIDAIVKIHQNDVQGAIAYTNEALTYSEKSLEAKPNSQAAIATKTVCQGFQKLFLAYQAGLEQNREEVVLLVDEAQQLADRAINENVSAEYFAGKIHEYGDLLLSQLP